MTENWPTYTATITREDGLWVAVISELAPAATDVEHFSEIKPAVRDLIAGLTDTTPEGGEFWVRWRFVQNDSDYSPVIEELEAIETEADRAVSQRDAFRRAAITSMQRAGLSLRDIADVLGISHQRVHQLSNERHGFNAGEVDALAAMNPALSPFEVGVFQAKSMRPLDALNLTIANIPETVDTLKALESFRINLPSDVVPHTVWQALDRIELPGLQLQVALPNIDFSSLRSTGLVLETLGAFKAFDTREFHAAVQAAIEARSDSAESDVEEFDDATDTSSPTPDTAFDDTSGSEQLSASTASGAEVIPFPTVVLSIGKSASDLGTVDSVAIFREAARRLQRGESPVERSASRAILDLLDKLGALDSARHA